MRRIAAVAVAGLVSLPAIALAQPGAVPAYYVPPPPPTAPVEPTPELGGIDRRQADDPGADRAYLARSALLAPSGSVTVQVRAPLAPGAMGSIAYSMGRVEVGVNGFVIAEEESAFGLNAKVQLLKGRRSALAVTLDTLTPPDDDETIYLSSLVASFCTDGDACNTLLSGHLTMLAADGEDEAPVFAGISFSKGRRSKLVGEFHITDSDSESVFAGYLGGRWGSGKLAFDAGIGFGGEDDDYDSDPDIVPYPFVGLSARM
jgi:hypothetical protein